MKYERAVSSLALPMEVGSPGFNCNDPQVNVSFPVKLALSITPPIFLARALEVLIVYQLRRVLRTHNLSSSRLMIWSHEIDSGNYCRVNENYQSIPPF